MAGFLCVTSHSFMQRKYEIQNGIIKRSTYGKKKILTKMSCSIDEFHEVHYQPMLKKYVYHRMLLCLLGKHECKNLGGESFMDYNTDVMTEREYAESLESELYIEIQ